MNNLQYKSTRVLLLFLLVFVVTTTFQKWIGDMTIYHPDKQEHRLRVHNAILDNKLPEGIERWRQLGATSSNIRILTVYLADSLAKIADISVPRAYRFIDTFALYFIFILLFIYLRKWFSEVYCIVGILYLGCIIVLTYLFHIYHPWDRISLLSWIILLILLQHKKLAIFGLVLAFSIIIKYDVILLPALYWLSTVSRDNWRKITFITLGFFTVSFGVFTILHMAYPEGETIIQTDVNFITFMIKANYSDMLVRNIRSYPPLLVFLVPMMLALYQLRSKERFIFSSVIFALALLIIFYLRSNILEVRAQMPVLVLILPAALASLQSLLETPSDSSTAVD